MSSKKHPKEKENKKHSSSKLAKQDNIASKSYLVLGAILLLTFLAYLPVLKNGFVNWDDYGYVIDNPWAKTFNFKAIFASFYLGNYHPLTMISYFLEYQLFGDKATGYHVVALLIHLANVFLVFRVFQTLTGNYIIALITALLFGVHPLHVETVAWASELKDVLYTFFFLWSYLLYLNYHKTENKKYYWYALLIFLVSLLSKAMAASLPLLLLLTDYIYADRNGASTKLFNKKSLLEKLPFFLFALAFGVIAIKAQQSSESINSLAGFGFFERIVFAMYGYISYLIKLVLPLDLSAFYPYPIKTGEALPFQFYLFALLFVLLMVLIVYSKRFNKKVIFAFGFFTATILLVLQLLPVGNVIMADRYSYIPSIGIFYLCGEGFNTLLQKNRRKVALMLTGIFIVFFSVITYTRCTVWHDGMSLWDDVIKKNTNVPIAYNNRGFLLTDVHRYDEALSDLNNAITMDPNYDKAYYNRGVLYFMLNNYELALQDFNASINLKKTFLDAYFSRGILYRTIKKYPESIADFNQCVTMKPNDAQIRFNRGLALASNNNYQEALADFNTAISINPNYTEAIAKRNKLLSLINSKQQ